MSSVARSRRTKVGAGVKDVSQVRFTDAILYFADEIPPDVIDVLVSCSDFEEFKSLMLSYKQNETPNFEITGDALICVSD